MTSMPANSTDEDLGGAILEGLRRSDGLPDWLDATIVLRADDERFTLRVEGGHPALALGEEPDADTTVTTDVETLRDVVVGKASGIDAFLDGHLVVRGNLALSLRLTGMWPEAGTAHLPKAADVQVDGLRTFYLEAGSGPPVVLLHGLGATNASMLPTLRDLSRDHRVIAPDLPGFGDTDKPIRPLHAAFFAEWLASFLAELGVERAHLVGNSMGGRVAIEAGLRHPELVDHLVLLAPSPAFLRGREWVRVVRLLRPEMAVVPLPLPHSWVTRDMRRMFSRPARLSPEWYDAAADEFLRVFDSVRGRICFFSAARQIYLEEPHRKPGGFWRRLPELDRPALFVWGERDRLVPAKFAEHVTRALPDAASVVLPDCGHVPQFERPDETHRLIREFLAGQE
jgi:pimeloyl-ACP methyl ester carboxylesterase